MVEMGSLSAIIERCYGKVNKVLSIIGGHAMNLIFLKDLELQWHDHFHMRDQTWKTLQYIVLFFWGVVGLDIKTIAPGMINLGYVAVCVTSALFFVSLSMLYAKITS